jgi:hypothetical protein
LRAAQEAKGLKEQVKKLGKKKKVGSPLKCICKSVRAYQQTAHLFAEQCGGGVDGIKVTAMQAVS